MSLSGVDAGFLSGSALLGITPSSKTGELIVSRKNGQIQIFNMDAHCCVKSWQLSCSQTLSCPVVQHPFTHNYWAVSDHTTLLSWRFSDDSLTCLPQELPSAVYGLLVAPGNKAPVAVLSNGVVCLAGDEKVTKKAKKKKVLFADVCVDQVCVVCACYGVTGVDVWAVDSNGVTRVTEATLNVNGLTAFCICGTVLIATDTTGGVHSWQLTNQISPLRSTSLSRPIKSQIVAMSPGCYVTCDSHALLMCESRYLTIQSELKVDVATLYSCYEWVCDGVRLWRVDSGACGLAGALGKVSSKPTSEVVSWSSKNHHGDSALADLLDSAKTQTLKQFMRVFSSCTLTPHICYSALVERVLDIWAPDALHSLIREGAVPLSLSDRVLQKTYAHRRWDLMTVCMECVGGLSESVIVEHVELLLRDTVSSVSNDTRDKLVILLLCQPFNDSLLQQPLSQLNVPTVRDLLQLITSHLTMSQLMTTPPDCYNALLDWAGQIIDVHITLLTFDPIARDVLVQLQQAVRDQVTCWNRLTVIQGVKGAWSSMADTPKTNGWLYRVETMDIDF